MKRIPIELTNQYNKLLYKNSIAREERLILTPETNTGEVVRKQTYWSFSREPSTKHNAKTTQKDNSKYNPKN